MSEKDLCKFVDVFYGNGEVDHFSNDGLSSKWFYIKALCGNTIPHPVLPFGKISVGPYSGGFPTGYGTHYPNSCGGIKKLSEKNQARGFSHLHQSGTGGIGFYYNYAIVTPFYNDDTTIGNYYELKNEFAVPGYYCADFNYVHCQLTVNESVAYHKYTFEKECGKLAIDFSNDGLSKQFEKKFYGFVSDAEVLLHSNDTVLFSGVLSGVKLYFAVKAEGNGVKPHLLGNVDSMNGCVKTPENRFGAVFEFEGKEILVKVSYSTIGYANAVNNIDSSQKDFHQTKKEAYDIWNSFLSVIDIDTDNEEFKKLFYSNLYHSLIKPADMTGEKILGIENDVVVDFATFWDQYKTVFPLIFTFYPEMGKKVVAAIKNISKKLDRIPNNLGLSNKFTCEEQAKMLGIYALCDAYYAGISGLEANEIDECVKRELKQEDFKSFLENGFFKRYTHILDVTDACMDVSTITKDSEFKKLLVTLSENWKNAYDTDGLMSENSRYYEGDRYTYSFRLQKNMQERIAYAGGKEKFTELLDNFFGFFGESIKQITYVDADEEISKTRYHRFEGFNNECDMETPYAYIFSDRHDRTCDIVHEALTKSYRLGKGGLPGNNDSGGLSSCFVWNALGLFPISGAGYFLVGSPHIKKAVMTLSNGKILEIEVNNLSEENYYVESVCFNGIPVENYIIETNKIMQGGKILFKMKSAVKRKEQG